MKALRTQTKQTLEMQKGTTLFEYALILALIAAICAGAAYTLQDATGENPGTISSSINP